MPQRILVLSASVGAGHLRAAEAVEAALRQLDPDALVQNIDVLEHTNATFRRVYGQAYLDLVNKLPHALGYFYDLLDRKPSPQRKSDRLRLVVEKLNLGKFLRLLQAEPWDVVVNTHFLPAEIIASLKTNGEFATRQMTVTTDFETHRLWVNQPCEHYFAATQEGAITLKHWGVPCEDISVTGIPIHPAFSAPMDRAECLRKFNLAGDRPIVVQMSGGFGVGPIEDIFRRLLEIETALQIVVVTGRNAELKVQLEQIEVPPRHRARILGFTANMHELISHADVVVSKPGGLTTSETLACGAAMAVVNPIPGQESRNSDFLLENGAAIKINALCALPYKLGQLLGDRQRLATLKVNARRIGRPRAAFDVARMALDWARDGR